MVLRIAKLTLCLLVFSLCYIQPFVYFDHFQIPPTEFIFLLTAALWMLALLTRQTNFRFHRFYWLLLFYFAAMLTSAIFSDNRQSSFIKLAGEVYLLCLPVLVFNLVESVEDLRRLLQSWLVGTACAVIFGVFVLFLFYRNPEHWLLDYTNYPFGAVPVGNYPRLRLNSLSPSLLCNYLSVGFSLLLTAASLGWIRKSFALVLSFLILLIAAFTISSGLGGFALIIGGWLYFRFRSRKKSFALLGLGGGVLTALLFWLINFVALQPHSTAPFSLNLFGFEVFPSPRVMVWINSFQTFRENPFFGRGVGQDSCAVIFQNTDGSFTNLTDAHNVFLSVASQEGIGGLVAVILIILYLSKVGFSAYSPFDKMSVLRFGLWIAFISAFVYQGLVGSFEDSRHLWVLIGLMLCANDSRYAENDLTHRPQ